MDTRPTGAGAGLLLDLYRIAREAAPGNFQQTALELLSERLPFDSATWGLGRAGSRHLTAIHAVRTFRKPDEWLTDYLQVKHQDYAAGLALTSRGGVVALNTATLYGRDDTADFREYTRRHGHEHILIGYAINPNMDGQWVSLYRANPDRPFCAADRALMELVAPHLLEAHAVSYSLCFPAARQPLRGHAIVSSAGVVLQADQEIAEILRQEFGIASLPRLPSAALEKLLADGMLLGPRAAIELRREGELLFLKARPRTLLDALTPREREVARHVAQGVGHKQVAQLLDISPATVRNHLRVIYQKLDVHNVAELIARLTAAQ